jgi:hypothetical protein
MKPGTVVRVFAIFACGIGSVIAQTAPLTSQQVESVDWSEAVSEMTPNPTDAHELDLRRSRNLSFNGTTGLRKPLDLETPDSNQGYGMSTYHAKLPTFPVSGSDAIVVGQVIGYQPFLSADRTTIYTELDVKVESVFKDNSSVLQSGADITIPRLGGAVRLPNRQVVKYFVPKEEKLLEVGRRYVLFLNRDEKNRWFGIVKVWGLQDGRVIAVGQTDISDVAQGVSKYHGISEPQFLQEVRDAVGQAASR